MNKKIAILSNVNMNYAVRILKDKYEMYEPEGFGNEIGMMLDLNSSYNKFQPDIVFLITDVMECLGHDFKEYKKKIDNYFSMLEACIRTSQIYYISDAYLWAIELSVLSSFEEKKEIERAWDDRLNIFIKEHSNVFLFPYHSIIIKLGEENAFSLRMWYLGKILHTNEMILRVCSCIERKINLQEKVPKKVLLLDLDNTLWGGLAGENEHTPIELSDDKKGLAYKNLQRVILQMKKEGVLLGIVSKNNYEDAMRIIEEHPHMVLKSEDFVIKKINWSTKPQNIVELSQELNLGLDSFAFFDDNPTERELVRLMLPQVEVLDFPKKVEELAVSMVQIYEKYFEKSIITIEDKIKTKQYIDNEKRKQLKNQAISFEEYLKHLDMEIYKESPHQNFDRVVQLVHKTNQFNLTSKRYSQLQLQKMIEEKGYEIFLYRVKDCFGDYGIVALLILNLSEEIPRIDSFIMSCRIMGKKIENALIDFIEKEMFSRGFVKLRANYIPTAKNIPVKNFYKDLGYSLVEDENGIKTYEIDLKDPKYREYYVKLKKGE